MTPALPSPLAFLPALPAGAELPLTAPFGALVQGLGATVSGLAAGISSLLSAPLNLLQPAQAGQVPPILAPLMAPLIALQLVPKGPAMNGGAGAAAVSQVTAEGPSLLAPGTQITAGTVPRASEVTVGQTRISVRS